MDCKECFKCLRTLPRGEFYRHRSMADGRLNKCKECTRADVSQHRKANIDRIREYDRKRSQQPRRKENAADYQRAYRARSREKVRARYAVAKAIRQGTLTSMPCEVCGEAATHAHHDDYSKPLDVRWLCLQHHWDEHR